ncbi:MAG: indole-3-glycerol-phosphate synthase [Gammaproteobacteria bacterium]|jgi:indole-3-glycerol phosphate synthase|nr:indole-3-glycerol-phosphate synthase [Gammaproteobacteria bacterium]|tara:strand:+ start:476 stop:1249 length:774 start_codon:yes stop_codon:yes gene_type:complete
MLKEIIENKKQEILELKSKQNLKIEVNQNIKNRGFIDSLHKKYHTEKNVIIAEIKKHSPSKGYLNKNLDVAKMAKLYEDAGAACISVLTDSKYFKGSLADLELAKSSTSIPILRKDFILDEAQIIESKNVGADCILLIVACLEEQKFSQLNNLSIELNLDVLVEVHNERELDIALNNGCKLIGINNRDLKTFEVTIQTTLDLIKKFYTKDIFFISESGIKNIDTIKFLRENNVNGFLIGEGLVTSEKPSEILKELVG